MNYILTFKTEPDLCGVSCLCAVDYGSDVSEGDRREIALDSLAERTADAADRGDS